MKNLNELKQSAETVSLPEAIIPQGGGRGKMSFSVVNSAKNGKRITITNTFATNIGITEKMSLLPLPDEDVILVGSTLPFSKAEECSLTSTESHKIAYDTRIVLWLTACLNLDYTSSTSKTFQDIMVDKLDDGTPVAIISTNEKSKHT